MLNIIPRRVRPLLVSSYVLRNSLLRPFSSKQWDNGNNSEPNEEELENARQWLAGLRPSTIPRTIGNISYSTSSGAGGQNVNRVKTKATLTVPLVALLPLVPKPLHSQIRSSSYFAKNSDSLVIQSQDTRSRTANLNRCCEKLLELLAHAGEEALPGRTSLEQQEKVKRLQAAEKESRMRMKKIQSQKKQSRKPRSFDD